MARRDDLLDDSSGLPSAFTLQITDAWWAPDARYNNGDTLLLHWAGNTDLEDPEYAVLDRNTFHVSFPAPAGWESVDGGATATRDGETKFKKNSTIGRVIERAMAQIPAGDPHDPFDDAGPEDLVRSDLWVGNVFYIEEEETDYGGDIGKRSRLWTQKWLGHANGGVTVTPAAGSAPAAAAASAPAEASTDDLETQVRALVAASPTFEDFRGAAMGIAGLAQNPTVLQKVIDQAGGYWSEKA